MADIAAIFHWPLDQIQTLSANDLLMWRHLAVESWNRMWPRKEGDK